MHDCCRAPARQHTILGISLDPVLCTDPCDLKSGSGVCLPFVLIVIIPGNSAFESFFLGGIKQYFFDCVHMFSSIYFHVVLNTGNILQENYKETSIFTIDMATPTQGLCSWGVLINLSKCSCNWRCFLQICC